MTKTQLKENWIKILDLLPQKGLDTVLINTYFEPLKPVKLAEKEQVLYLYAPWNAEFMQQQVKRHQDTFVAATEEILGKPYIVQVVEEEIDEENGYDISQEDSLEPSYTFSSFVQGPNNRLAYVISQAVAEGYSKKYNPLFIYAGSGLGKTHLMQAIGHEVIKNKPKKKVLYVSSETFISELIEAIRTGKQKAFKDKYQSVDYLLFDDIQFITQSNTAMDELFFTFEALSNAGKQMVFTSDRPPKELGNLPERLESRFVWGMTVDIQAPSYETRMAILKNKAALENLDLNNPQLIEVLDIIAQSINTNIRELEGSFKRVFSYATIMGEDITVQLTKKVLTDVFKTQEVELTPEAIKRFIANYYNIKVSDLESPNRSRNINYPRQIAIYLIRNNTDLSYPQIGELFGGRDHTSIMHAYEKVSNDIKTDKNLSATIDDISRKMRD